MQKQVLILSTGIVVLQNRRGESFMKKRVTQVLSLLCILALAFGCLTTAAADGEQMEARIIAVQWEGGNGESASRPEISVSYGAQASTVCVNS